MTDNLELPTLACLRCEHTWFPRSPKLPKVCPKCSTPYWNKPRQMKWAIDRARGKKGKEVTWEGHPTALHEAGHAVYAYASGCFKPSYIEITPDGNGHVSYDDLPKKRSLGTGPVILHRTELELSEKVAGKVAREIAGLPEADRGNLVRDSHEVERPLEFLADCLDEGRDEIYGRAWTRAKELLVRHWDVVVDLAKGVELRRSISGEELEGFLESRLEPFALSEGGKA